MRTHTWTDAYTEANADADTDADSNKGTALVNFLSSKNRPSLKVLFFTVYFVIVSPLQSKAVPFSLDPIRTSQCLRQTLQHVNKEFS